MALNACMWTGVSGLLAHGEKMNVIGNNIANVNTVGFKGQRMDFADFVYANTFSNQGVTQIGRGVKIGAIMQNFQTGPFENSTESTDLALDGRGFFKVKKIGTDQEYFTRAGNFRFNAKGYLTDPNGLAVQGWKVKTENGVQRAQGGGNPSAIDDAQQSAILGTGVPMDVKLDTWTVIPQQTTKTTMKVNLPKDGSDRIRDDSNPLASLMHAWNGTQPPASPNTPPFPDDKVHQTSIQVYDASGTKHTLTVYFDKISKEDYEGGGNGEEMWEFIVTMDPAEDKRQFYDTVLGDLRNVNETAMGGLLMTGTLTFNEADQLLNQSAYTWGGTQSPDTHPGSFTQIPDPGEPLRNLDVINLPPVDANGRIDMNNWYPAEVSTSGLPVLVPNFGGILDAQTSGSPRGEQYFMEVDFGLSGGNLSMPWENSASLGSMAVDPYVPNPGYIPGRPLTNPQYLLLNPNYDSSLDMWEHPNGFRYQLVASSGVAYPYTGPALTGTALEDYQKVLIQMMGADTGLKCGVDAFQPGLPAVAGCTYRVDSWPIDINTNIIITDETGTDIHNFPISGLAAAEQGPAIAKLQADVEAKVRGGKYVDYTVMSPATPANANDIAEFTKPVNIDPYTCTNNNADFFANVGQNGYGHGDLTSWSVDTNGVLYGNYSNGVSLPLWQLTIYDHTCPQGLRREGNNLFSATRQSGDERSGAAGQGGLGNVQGYTLEQSNVDMSTEFVNMITTQRGFQGNSKIITTTDTMLDTVINMKR